MKMKVQTHKQTIGMKSVQDKILQTDPKAGV